MTELLVALLMRVWVAEAGWTAERDHAIMGHTLLRHAKARGVGLEVIVEEMVDQHSNALKKKPWLLELGPNCLEPTDYPRAWVPVSCAQLASRAYALLRGELKDPCPRAQQWRMAKSKALRKALRLGYRRLNCGKTVDVYLMEPLKKKKLK